MRNVKLSDVALVVSGQHILESDYNQRGQGIGYLTGPADFGPIQPIISRWTQKPKVVCEPDDILVTVKGAGVGKINIAPEESVAIGRQLMAVRGNSDVVETDYLFNFLLTRLSHFQSKAVGATIPGLSREDLEKLDIPLPHIKDQRRIATHLKSQIAAIEEACNAAQSQIIELTNLANAIIRQSVEHPDTGSANLGNVLEEVKKGIGAKWADYPVLGATRKGLALAKDPVGKAPERYKPVFCGTVFYNPMRIMIGSIAMVDDNDTPGITSPDYVAVKGRPGKVDSRWFYYWLRSPFGERCIASLARGAVRERMLFNRLAEGSIELPPYEVQVAASRALAEIQPMKTAAEAQLREIEKLPSRLLAQAFDS
jgi:type I restriction enzyme S subunit